jgi:hypothetical protein
VKIRPPALLVGNHILVLAAIRAVTKFSYGEGYRPQEKHVITVYYKNNRVTIHFAEEGVRDRVFKKIAEYLHTEVVLETQ